MILTEAINGGNPKAKAHLISKYESTRRAGGTGSEKIQATAGRQRERSKELRPDIGLDLEDPQVTHSCGSSSFGRNSRG